MPLPGDKLCLQDCLEPNCGRQAKVRQQLPKNSCKLCVFQQQQIFFVQQNGIKMKRKKSFYNEQVINIRASRREELRDFRVSPCPIKVSFYLKKIQKIKREQ